MALHKGGTCACEMSHVEKKEEGEMRGIKTCHVQDPNNYNQCKHMP